MTGSYISHQGNFGTEFCLLFQKALTSAAGTFFEGIFPSVCAFAFGTGEDDWLSILSPAHLFPDAGSWPLRTLSNCVPLKAFSQFPFFAGFSPFLTLGYCPSLIFRSGLWSCAFPLSDQYDVLFLSSTWSSLVVRYFEHSLVRTEPTSWTYSCYFELCTLSRTVSVGISLAANRAWFHLVSRSWTSSSSKRILNRSDGPCTGS